MLNVVQWTRSRLRPPQFEHDEEKTRLARLLNSVTLTHLAVVSPLALALGVLPNPGLVAVIVGTLIAFDVAAIFLMRRGHVSAGSWLLIAGLWSLQTLLSAFSAGVNGLISPGYIVIVVIAVLLLGTRGGMPFSGLCIVTLWGMVLLQRGSLLPTPWVSGASDYTAIGLSVYIAISVGLLQIAVRNLQTALSQARGSNRDLQTAQAELEARVLVEQEQRQQLQRLMHAEQAQQERLRQILAQVQDTAGSLNSAAAEILSATTQQATGASEQSAAIAQASTTIDEVRAIAEQSTQRAQSVADVAQHTASIAEAGQQAIDQNISGMLEVKAKVDMIAHNVLTLSEKAQAIGQIIATVGEIASQSNMLALNAAVEAARAGEAGRGFAVVAGEVRSLAERSRAATVQVRELLNEIQQGVNTAVMATEEGLKGAEVGVGLVNEAGAAIRRLAQDVSESAQSALQIVAASRQQLAGIEQIASAVQSIHQVTTQTVASTRQTEHSAQDLNTLAGRLWESVEQNRL